MRIYSDEAKYDGLPSSLFNTKFEIFFSENGVLVVIVEEDKCEALRIMLKDKALNLYRVIVKENYTKSLETLSHFY